MKKYFWWHLGNKIRRGFGLKNKPKGCCRKKKNRVPYDDPTLQPGTTVQRCKVCKCRHFEAIVDPGEFGLKGTGL